MFLQEFPSKALRSDALLLLVSAVLGPYVGAFGNAEGGGGYRFYTSRFVRLVELCPSEWPHCRHLEMPDTSNKPASFP